MKDVIGTTFRFAVREAFKAVVWLYGLFSISCLRMIFRCRAFRVQVSPYSKRRRINRVYSVMRYARCRRCLFLFRFVRVAALGFLFRVRTGAIRRVS